MTIEEFNNTRFGSGDKVIYDGKTWPIVEIDFKESLFGIPYEENIEVNCADQITWVRCENCEFISKTN